MQFTTQIPISAGESLIDYNSRVVCLGSCFAVNIGQKFEYFKFRNMTNPFGILFHPEVLEKFISFAVNKKTFTENDIFFHNERWHCYDAHSDLSHPDKEVLLERLTSATSLAHDELKSASHLIITLGTAWVYRNVQTGNLVANCHKVPQKEFTKELLSVDAIKQSLDTIFSMLEAFNPALKLIFTVSPVRHLKDGFTENQWSKSNLISALHGIMSRKNSKLSAIYFPSYEIMMDELRDYRFYAEDMIHPNQIAINYIWERFTQVWISPEAQDAMQQVDNIQKGLQHRSFNPNSEQHKAFLAKLHDKIVSLQQRHPHITF